MNIVIYQATTGGTDICAVLLSQIGLIEGIDFEFVSYSNIIDAIKPDERQLFVTGWMKELSDREMENLIKTIREINPQLVCVSFASLLLTGQFERQILKRGITSFQEFKKVVSDFMGGQLSRTN